MENLISLFILIPLIGFVINFLIPKNKELILSRITFVMVGGQFVLVLLYTIWWVYAGCKPIYKKQITLFHLDEFELLIDFVYDWITATYLLIGAFITFLITSYSRNYLHREVGFKRFFVTILLFYLGYNVIVLSSNLTSIFIGWEIAGISSFLLIAYYRNRYIPVNNAVKIFTLYRLGDVCIILAMWFGHQIMHHTISIDLLSNHELIKEAIGHSPGFSLCFSICVLVAAAIKSAQFPFSSWLPRAMEGPTPSSAIFYSSLAVHLGILFLLRTYNFWIYVPYVPQLVIASGAISFVIGTVTSRIQPTIKGQLAYAIVAQVGVMAIEVALGWHVLALIHFASHAMLRSYQLLISPSIVNYAIKKQFFDFTPRVDKQVSGILRNFSNSIYILSLNEWYLDRILHQITWGWLKKTGKLFPINSYALDKKINLLIWICCPSLVIFLRYNSTTSSSQYSTLAFLTLAILLLLRIFVDKKEAINTWLNVSSVHLMICCGLIINGISYLHVMLYAAGILISFLTGYLALKNLIKKEGSIELSSYQGHCYEHPQTELVFMLSVLGLMGFPITPAFVGVELLFANLNTNQYLALALLSLFFMLNGLAMMRMYARIFLGPHIKTYHETARKSS